MNFLAHIYLSQEPPELLVGNFIGDFVKGKAYQDYPATMQKGILLHREIDAFTDVNDWVKKSKSRLFPKYRHYSAVIVDMFYDHFLAANWNDYHSRALNEFAADAYKILNAHWEFLPKPAQYMLPYMMRNDWLTSYAHTTGLNKALSGLASRSRFISYMEEATADLLLSYEEYKTEFTHFFPMLISHANAWKQSH